MEDFEVDARAAVASQAERDKEVLQKLLTVKDQMIWCVRADVRHTLAVAASARFRRPCTLTFNLLDAACASNRSLIEERDALRERLQGDSAAP